MTKIRIVWASLLISFACHSVRAQWVDFTDQTGSHLDTVTVDLGDTLEKDLAIGDFNQDGWVDVIVVRKNRFGLPGTAMDVLFMNEGGLLVNRTTQFAPDFRTHPTTARDVLVGDIDSDGWLDLVISNTDEQQPALYRNLGLDEAQQWLGFADESFRLPTIVVDGPIQLCVAAMGDLNGDGAMDIYFGNYTGVEIIPGQAYPFTFDILLINDGNGYFSDQTESRMRSEQFGDYSASAFDTSVELVDLDNDGDLDIIKNSGVWDAPPWDDVGVFLLFNDGNGFFNTMPFQPVSAQIDNYMFAVGDLNNDNLLDMFFQNNTSDRYWLSSSVTKDSPIKFGPSPVAYSPRLAAFGGMVRMVDIDNDGDLDVGIASVDTKVGNCTGHGGAAEMTLLRNENIASGILTDPYIGTTNIWNNTTFDFEFLDIDHDGLLDLFMANCEGYQVLIQSAEIPIDCNENSVPDDVDIADGTSSDCNANAVPDQCDIDPGKTTEWSNDTGGSLADSAARATFGRNLQCVVFSLNAPIFSDGVTIRKNDLEGFIYQIDLFDEEGNAETVWSSSEPGLPTLPGDYTVTWPESNYLVHAIRLCTDSEPLGSEWRLVDSLQIHGHAPADSQDNDNDGTPDECQAAIAVSTSSHAMHGGSEFALDLTENNIEPRVGGVTELAFELSKQVESVDAEVSCAVNGYQAVLTVAAVGSTVTVEFAEPLPDQDCCTITLSGDAVDEFVIRTLQGDLNRDGVVSTGDASRIKARFGNELSQSNISYDFNQDGAIDAVDQTSVIVRFGRTAAVCEASATAGGVGGRPGQGSNNQD